MLARLRARYRASFLPGFVQVSIEFTVILIFATCPFWLGTGVYGLAHEFSKQSWFLSDAILSTFTRGELLIFAVTFVAPMFWTVSLDPEGSKSFPGRPVWVASVAVLLLLASAFYGVWRAWFYTATTYSTVIYWSICAAIAAMLLRLIIMAIHQRRLPHPEQVMNDETDEFADGYAQGREIDNGN